MLWACSGDRAPEIDPKSGLNVWRRAGRLMAAVGAGLWGMEAARFNSDLACVYTLASLPTPLGGEVAELIKQRDPMNPALLCVRRPGSSPGLLSGPLNTTRC